MSRNPKDEPYLITIEVVNTRCKVSRTLIGLGIKQFKIIDIRAFPAGLTSHLVKIPTKQLDKIPRGSVKIQSSDESKKETSGWFDSEGCDVCNTILSQGIFLISGRSIKDDTLVYSFITRNFEAFKSIISKLEDTGLKPRVLEAARYKARMKILTEKQERLLWLAFKMGFFDYPRKINTTELSHRLGMEASTFSEITRRGMRRLLEHHFET